MRGGEPQLGPAMADSGLPVETPPPPLGDTTDESAPGLPTPAETLRRASLGGTATQPGICSAEGPDARPDDRGPSPKARRIVTSGCSTWNEPVNQLKSLERQFHVEQSQVLT
jgi:hypothetical protein